MDNKRKNLDLILSLARISFLNLAEKLNLLKKLDSSNDLALMSIEDIRNFTSRPLRLAAWNGKENLRQARIEANIIEAKGIGCVLYTDSDYPVLLKEIPNAPFALFYRGDISILNGECVSVVGTRRITQNGRKMAFSFARDACIDGTTVVSGLANGVDGYAHSGCVQAYFDSLEKNETLPGGKTCAVLPCGIDMVVPYGHKKLAGNILKSGGLILSEYVPGTPSENFRYVQRNRIIAALSKATVVVEAPDGSGALITCQFALDYNRDVMFHKACFENAALQMREAVHKQQELDFAAGKISRAKLENSAKKYLEAGAPVISDYKDYLRCLAEVPGTRSFKCEQLELFE